MFYVAKGKVYSATFDTTKGVYPEVEVYAPMTVKQLATGVKTKPAERQVCTLAEVVAQFGVKEVVAASKV